MTESIVNCSEKGKRMKVKIFLHKSFVFAQIFHRHPLIRINCQNFERISLKISLNCVTFIKFTHVLDATAKWSLSRHRQGRYGGKLHNNVSRK